MDNKEARALLKAHNHKIQWCSTCRYPVVICGKCGLNQCSCGSNCNMCEEAYQIMLAIKYPYRYLLLAKLYYKVIDPITLRASNTKYYIEEGWKKLWKKKK